MDQRRVVVTGIGAVTPIGIGKEEFWKGTLEGRSGAGPITSFDTTGHLTTFACEVKGFEPEAYMDRKTAARNDRYVLFALAAAGEALRDSAIDLDAVDRDRFGVVFGSGIGGMKSYDHHFRAFIEGGPRRVSPFFVPQIIADMAAGLISIEHGLRGPNYATVSACATSIHALIDGYLLLTNGFADQMLCGGSEASVTPMSVAGFNAAKALSTRNDDPATASRPYDADRDGFVLGEGAGALLLETLESAQARGAHIYAELCGVGLSADAYHITAPLPDGSGAARAMRMAIERAGLRPSDIDCVNAHGTSTELGDLAEIAAVRSVFGAHAHDLNISAGKSMTGHLLGAAGAVESIACLIAIAEQLVPATINIEHLDPAIDLNVTPNVAQRRSVRYVLNNGFGFGGHNATLIFGAL